MIYIMKQEIPKEQYLTYNQMNIIIAFQKLWLEVDTWMKAYLRAVIYDTRNLKSVANYLINIPNKVYSMNSMFYGPEVGQILKNLAFDLIISQMEVIEPIKYGDNVLMSSRTTKWYKAADKLSSYLAKINIYWDEKQWKYFLYNYIKIKIDEIQAVANDNFEEEIKLYEIIENNIFLMANYMARGIISSAKRIPNQ